MPTIVSRDEWLVARKALLIKEKEHMRAGDRLSAERRALPWVEVDKEYVFDTPDGKKTLADLFEGRSQLIVHHLMYHPDWDAACAGCSFQADHIDGPGQHLAHHDVRIVAVSRAPLAKLVAYKRRMGWRFDWVSSYGSDFNYDFHVSFTREQLEHGKVEYNYGLVDGYDELPGVSVFRKNQDGQVFHTYSPYARGLDAILGGNHYLDLTPQGRSDEDYPDWPRRHDEYADEGSRQSSVA